MDKLSLRRLAGIDSSLLTESKNPPEGLFANGSSEKIIVWLKKNYKDYSSAASALNFFINITSKNLSSERKSELKAVKNGLKVSYNIKESSDSMDSLRRMAGLPRLVREKNEDPEELEDPIDEPATEEDELITKLAKKAEGLTGDDMLKLIKQVYDAGVSDGSSEDIEDKENSSDSAEVDPVDDTEEK